MRLLAIGPAAVHFLSVRLNLEIANLFHKSAKSLGNLSDIALAFGPARPLPREPRRGGARLRRNEPQLRGRDVGGLHRGGRGNRNVEASHAEVLHKRTAWCGNALFMEHKELSDQPVAFKRQRAKSATTPVVVML